jgi:DNA-binding response OmpR family regulator
MLPRQSPLATVVVCDDDEATLEPLCDHLRADRYEPLAAPTASDALRHCHYSHPDLLLLDVGLPDASGLEVIREIRDCDAVGASYDRELPIIILSGFSEPHQRVRGIVAGADDYLTKPFHYPELVERIGAVLRRNRGRRSGPRRIREIVIDPASRIVTVGDRRVELSNKEFSLLSALASEPTRVFSKEELLRDVWGYRSMGRTRTLDSHASRLRRKLDPEHRRFVVNTWGVGYRLVDS